MAPRSDYEVLSRDSYSTTLLCVQIFILHLFKSAMFKHWKQLARAPRTGRTDGGKDDAVRTETSRGPDRDQQAKGTSRGRTEDPQGSGSVQTVRRRRFRAFLSGTWFMQTTNGQHPAP